MNLKTGQKGYTLVEALIAVAILAAIAGALAPITLTAIKAAGRINAEARRAEIDRVGENALSEIFAAMIVPRTGDSATAFTGARDKIGLFILIDQEHGPRQVTLEIKDGALLHAPPAQNFVGANGAGSVQLAENVASFRYFGIAADSDEPEWRSIWEESDPPRLVEINYATSAKAPRRSRAFALSSRAPLHCAFDQVSRQCRD